MWLCSVLYSMHRDEGVLIDMLPWHLLLMMTVYRCYCVTGVSSRDLQRSLLNGSLRVMSSTRDGACRFTPSESRSRQRADHYIYKPRCAGRCTPQQPNAHLHIACPFFPMQPSYLHSRCLLANSYHERYIFTSLRVV